MEIVLVVVHTILIMLFGVVHNTVRHWGHGRGRDGSWYRDWYIVISTTKSAVLIVSRGTSRHADRWDGGLCRHPGHGRGVAWTGAAVVASVMHAAAP